MRLLVLLLLLTVLSSFSCDDGEDLMNKKNQNESLFFILLMESRSQGNCRSIITNSTTLVKTTACSRRPSGLCNINLAIVTQGEINFSLTESKKVTDRTPDCQESFIQSGILSTKSTTQTEEDSLRLNNEYTSVNSCESDGFEIKAGVRLATYEEILFLESVRGKIGRSARTLAATLFLPKTSRDKATICQDKEYSETERNLFKDLIENKLIIEVNK